MRMLSVITPCFNEEENVEEVYRRVREQIGKLGRYRYEHLFIDNASTDGTVAILKRIAATDANVRIIVNARNFGHIRSPMHALLQTRGDAVISIVADLQDPPEMIPQLVEKWEEGFQVVLCIKRASEETAAMFWLRKSYYALVERLSSIPTIQNFTAEMAEAQGLGAQRGAIVANVTPGGPSERGGLQSGDIVTSVNGVNVKSSSELTREVAKAKAGDTLRLDVLRGGKRKTIDIRSGVRPTEKELAANDNTQGGPSRGGNEGSGAQAQRPVVLGLALAPLDETARRRLSIEPAIRGVLIDRVDQSSDAAQRGLRKDDIIVQAGGQPVTTAAEFSAQVDIAKKAGRPSVLVGVHRGGRTSFLPLKIGG